MTDTRGTTKTLMTRMEVAERLRCCERTIYRATLEGEILPTRKTPALYDEKDVCDYLNDHKCGMASELAELPERLFQTKELSKVAGVNANTVKHWVKQRDKNKMPCYALSQNHLLFSMDDLVRWLTNQRAERAKAAEAMRQEYEEAKALLVKKGLVKA